MLVLESVDCWHHDVVVLAAFGELELLQLGLPTDEAQKILRIYEEIEERFRLWQEDVLDLGADHCFEVGVGSIAD